MSGAKRSDVREATVHLGYEIGTGKPVTVPLRHLAVTGQTQLSGKTTTLEALIARSGRSAVAFMTKRGEGGFSTGHRIPPFFRERADWQFVSAVLEATLRERMRFERSWIMRACKGAETLADVQRNVRHEMKSARGMSADVYLTLDHYLDIVVPQVDRLPFSAAPAIGRGLNVMDLSGYSMEMQALVIRSVIEWVYEKAEDTLVVIPEAWEFIPQNRGSPVLLACESLIRKGGNLGNFVWLDSQDIAGVHKNVLRSVGVWIVGVQREANEVKRALGHIPGGVRRPSVDDITGLERGRFFVCFDRVVAKVYVQPAWMDAETARDVALGRAEIIEAPRRKRAAPKAEVQVNEKEAQELREANARLTEQVSRQAATIVDLERRLSRLAPDAPLSKRPGADAPTEEAQAAQPERASPGVVDFDTIYAEVKKRAAADPGVLKLLAEKPEIAVTVERKTVELTEATLLGRCAGLIAKGFFDEPTTASAAFTEFQKTGFRTAKPNVYKECDRLTTMGFLVKLTGGYQAVPGMKINIVEA